MTDQRLCHGCHPYVWPNGPIDHEPGCAAFEVTVTTEKAPLTSKQNNGPRPTSDHLPKLDVNKECTKQEWAEHFFRVTDYYIGLTKWLDAEIERLRADLEHKDKYYAQFDLTPKGAAIETAARRPGHVQLHYKDAIFAAQALIGSTMRDGDECVRVGRRIEQAIKAAAGTAEKAFETPASQPDTEFERLLTEFGNAMIFWATGSGSRESVKAATESVLAHFYGEPYKSMHAEKAKEPQVDQPFEHKPECPVPEMVLDGMDRAYAHCICRIKCETEGCRNARDPGGAYCSLHRSSEKTESSQSEGGHSDSVSAANAPIHTEKAGPAEVLLSAGSAPARGQSNCIVCSGSSRYCSICGCSGNAKYAHETHHRWIACDCIAHPRNER